MSVIKNNNQTNTMMNTTYTNMTSSEINSLIELNHDDIEFDVESIILQSEFSHEYGEQNHLEITLGKYTEDELLYLIDLIQESTPWRSAYRISNTIHFKHNR